jgi:hypothetical protein
MLSTFIVYMIYKYEDINFPRAYCTSTTPHTSEILGDYMKYMTFVDLLITIGDFALWLVNKVQLKRLVV